MDEDARRKAMILGGRLRSYRGQAGLTVNGLAEYSGVSAAYISRLERGLVPRPSAPTLQKLADRLGVTLPALMGTERTAEDALNDPKWNLWLRKVKGAKLSEHDEQLLLEQADLALRMLMRQAEATDDDVDPAERG